MNRKMTKLYLYTAFHANLKFSSIPEDEYSLVLDRCYWSALDLLKDYDIRLGLEFPASTLEITRTVDEVMKSFHKSKLLARPAAAGEVGIAKKNLASSQQKQAQCLLAS